MTDGETNDFAAFEAQASKSEEVVETPEVAEDVKEPVVEDTKEVAEAPADDKADDTPEDAPEEETAEEEEDEKPKKRRSKPASERIAELTARLRETERQLEAKNAPVEKQEAKLEKPNPEDFEYGESDPDYIDKLTDYKIDAREAAKEAKATEEQGEQRTQQQMFDKINTGVALAEENAKAKYDDFDKRIAEAVKARDGEVLPPLLTLGIGISPVGGDIIYRLATDEDASEKLEKLAMGGAQTANAMAMALGELEGEYLEDDSDSDLDTSDQMDMARMMGRMRARLKGTKAPTKAGIRTSNAPDPPKQRARGGSGQLGTPPDTTDFAAFEKLAGAR